LYADFVSPNAKTVIVCPVLFGAPVFWGRHYWADSAHQWDWVQASTPLADRPSLELEVSGDVTLGDVFDAACDAWGIVPGPDQLKYEGSDRRHEFCRFAFVRADRDVDGIDAQEGYQWPSRLQVARLNGTVELVRALDITIAELIVSASLGLVEGDPLRPYVCPVRPQGIGGVTPEIVHVTIEAIRAAYGALEWLTRSDEHIVRLVSARAPELNERANEVIDEGVRIGVVIGFARWLRAKVQRRQKKH
jgi:hypothetical protein